MRNIFLAGLLLSCSTPVSTDLFYMPDMEQCSSTFVKAEVLSRASSFKVVTLNENGVGHGSGAYVKYAGKYYILTAHHVVQDAQSIMVLDDSGAYNASILAANADEDLAILVLTQDISKQSIQLRSIRHVKPDIFDEIVYTGFPNLTGPLTIRGIISGRAEDGSLILQSYAWMGASGSVILNKRGQIVGVLNGIELARGLAGDYVANSTIVLANKVPEDVLSLLDSLE